MPAKILFILLFAGLFGTLGYFHCYRDQQKLIEGCDEFGYLHLSEMLAEGRTFKEHAHRPFLPELLHDLKASGLPFKDYSWMLTPHAYHVDEQSGKIVNQYPPGTSFLLRFFPKAARRVFFPTLSLVLLTVLPMFVLRAYYPSAIIACTSMVWLTFLRPPFRWEYHVINSLAPSFGFLVTAGALLPLHPAAALFLLGISVNFRIANLILMPAFLLYAMLYADPKRLHDRPKFARYSFNVGQGLLCFFAGCLPYLFYMTRLLGSPLATSYAAGDRAFTYGDAAWRNFSSYVTWSHGWARVHLIAIAGILAFKFAGKISWKLLFSLLLMTAMNYAFFIFHEVNVFYYPHASAMVLIGVLLYLVSANIRFSSRVLTLFIYANGLVAAFWLGFLSTRNYGQHTKQHQALTRDYQECFAQVDVVWGDMKSGTVEYYTEHAGFRYFAGTPETRAFTMKWLHDHGYRQVLWPEDIKQSTEELDKFVLENKLPVQRKSCRFAESLIEIPPKQS